MKKLLKEIEKLERVSRELEPEELVRDKYLKQIQNYINGFLNYLNISKTYSGDQVTDGSLAITSNKHPIKKLITTYANEVASKGINCASGGDLGYIPGGGIFTSSVADYLASATNIYAGLHYASPGAVVMENETLNWMKSIFGFPKDATGSLTSGGSIANLIALTAARDKHKIKGNRINKSVVYLSYHAHHCIIKALRIIGLEDINIRFTDLDSNHKIDTRKLKNQIDKDKAEALNPFLVIATAGTTDTGAVDPLLEISAIARSDKLWFHVDAAYGGFFILTKGKCGLLNGIEQADSLVVDPHKGLFVPYGTGVVLVKDKDAVLHSHHYTANYMQDATCNDTIISPSDVSPELTRHFRALRIWLPLQIHGIAPFKACLEEKLLLTKYFREKIKIFGFKVGPEPDLSISYFWYPSKAIDEDTFNQKLLELILKDGNVFFSSTRINNKFVIRVAIFSFRTKRKVIDKAIEIINKVKLQLERDFNYT